MNSGSTGAFGFFPQTVKGTAATGSEFYWMEANQVALGANQLVRGLGPLVGGTLLPGKQAKTANWSGGRVVLPPILEANIGWLLYTFAGSCSSAEVPTATGTYEHKFPANGSDTTAPQKWLTVHKITPEGTGNIGEEFIDQVVSRIVLGFTPGEYANMQLELLGRAFNKDDDVSSTGWTPAYEDETAVPIVTKGHYEAPDATALTNINGVTVEMVNIMPDLREVLVVGEYSPLGFPVLGRNLTVTLNALWENHDLYESIIYDTSGDWEPLIYSTSLDLRVETPAEVWGTGTDLPMALNFYAEEIEWTAEPIALEGAGLIRMNVTGTVSNNPAGVDWYMSIVNEETSYTWPT